MKKFCQGYCGGMYPTSELRQIGRDGEFMCEECASIAKGEASRTLDASGDYVERVED